MTVCVPKRTKGQATVRYVLPPNGKMVSDSSVVFSGKLTLVSLTICPKLGAV